MKNIYLLISLFLLRLCCFAQPPAIEWQKCLGGSEREEVSSIQLTSDGGYILAGLTFSIDGDVIGNHDSTHADAWVVKLDATGNLQWQKCLGGTYTDVAYSIYPTADGGYMVACDTKSDDGDVSGNHTGSNSYSDAWIVKLDQSGNIQWQKCLGGSLADGSRCIIEDADGNYILLGAAVSNDGDVTGNYGLQDFWLVKMDNAGTILWQKCLGGSLLDVALSLQQTSDGGFIASGYTTSNNGDVSGNHGLKDYWVVKTDSGGSLQWQKCLGGTDDEEAWSIEACTDGSFLVAGHTHSTNGDVNGNHGEDDIWVTKLDSTGNIIWKKCLGGTSYDFGSAVLEATDGNYLVAGYAFSNDSDVSGNHGLYDYWIVKLDTGGNIIWQECLGGSKLDKPACMQLTPDSSFIIAGVSASDDGDVASNYGIWDIWIVKLDASQLLSRNDLDLNSDLEFSIYPTLANSNINIYARGNISGSVEIYNSMGQRVYQLHDISQSASLTIPVHGLSPGIFIVKIVTGEKEFAERFIKY